jgi:hypothetical protein
LQKIAMVQVPAALLDQQLAFVSLASATVKKALEEVGVSRQAQKRAADLRAPLLAHMIQAGVVRPQQKEAAEAMLGSHAETLQLLKAATDKITELRSEKKAAVEPGAAGDGTPTAPPPGEKNGSDYNSLTDPNVGRRTTLVKESDKPLLALIGK